MPDRREIERLKKIVRSLADEEEVLAERGEPIVEPPPPPDTLPLSPEDIARVSGRETPSRPPPSLLDFDALPGRSPEPSPEPSPPMGETEAPSGGEGPSIADFSSLLQDIDLSEEGLEEIPEEGGTASAVEEAPEDLSPLEGLMEAAPPSSEGGGFDAFGGEGTDEEGGPSLDQLLSGLGPEPEASEQGLEEGGAGFDAGFGTDFSFGGDEGFEAPLPHDGGEGEAQGLGEEASEGGSALPEDEGFDLASFVSDFRDEAPEGESVGMEPSPESAAPEIGAPAAEESAPEESLFSESPAEGLPDFGESPGISGDSWGDLSLPEPDSFGLPAMDALPAGESTGTPGAEPQADDAFFGFGLGEGAPASDNLDEPLKTPETFSLGDDWEEPAGGMEMRAPDLASSLPEPDSWSDAAAGSPEAEEGPRTVALDEKALDRLQDALLSYPLNLRVEIEKSIAEEVLNEAQTARIVDAMASGMSAAELAPILGRMLGRRIKVPKGFERRTGEALEAEQGTFWYAFKRNILPVVGWFAAGIAVLAVAILSVWHLIYVPLRADWYYRSGLAYIARDDYLQAETLFETAWSQKRSKEWHFRYADAYRARKAWEYAERKYRQMLEGRYPRDKRAALAWAEMESVKRQDYRLAAEILRKHLLEWYPKDAQGLTAFGDNALAWADDEGPGEARDGLLEQARVTYASLIRLYGRKDPYLGRMARYFVRTGKLSEVLPLRDLFLRKEKPEVDALILAEMGGFLVDRKELNGVQELLALGVDYDPLLPEGHYNLARYYKASGLRDKAVTALDGALAAYRAQDALSRKRVGEYLDSLNWRGREAFARSQAIPARDWLEEGVRLYEEALENRRLEPASRFGELYAGLGDILYSHDIDEEGAFDQYQKAEEQGFVDQSSLYRRGYARYRQNRHDEALLFFYRADADYPSSQNLSLALASTLAARADWSAAAAGYRDLAGRLREELDDLESLSELRERPDQGRLLLMEMMTRNNLGVALYQLSLREGSVARRSEAMSQFTEASRLYDRISRDPDSMVRLSEFDQSNFNLPYANLDGIFHSVAGFQPRLYAAISRDLEERPIRSAYEDSLLYGTF